MIVQFADTVTIEGTRVRQDGYLVADARIARTGIQRYLGVEVGKPDLPFVDVYRPEAEVFSADAMASFAHIPVTDDHPKEAVTSDTWKKLAVGQTDGEIRRDGDFLRVPLMVADGATIGKINSGKRELSAGYTCDMVFQDGVTPEGVAYGAIQTNIRANHVAVVDRGRAGKQCRIGDSEAPIWGTTPIIDARKDQPMPRIIMVDGLSVETTDAGAQAIEKLIGDRKGLQDQLTAATSAHTLAVADLNKQLAAKDAALDDAKAKVLDAAAISKLVADRVALEAVAVKIFKDVKPVGLTDAELKVAVVKGVLGDKVPADKLTNQSYVDARFDILAEDANKVVDTFRDARLAAPGTPQNVSDAAAARQQAFDALVHFDQTGQELKAN
ncbi:putative major head subunit precursor protein [Rhizobium phage RHph_I72]|nr:putative major head subunit precursor protein [Rhizobium phage RHph_I72]